MHTLEPLEPIPVYRGQTMLPGKGYLMPNISCGMLLQDTSTVINREGREVPLFSVARIYPATEQPFDPSEDWNDRTIHLFRAGGFGDLLFLTPTIRELKRRWPDCNINIACSAEYKDILIGLPVSWTPMPVCVEAIGPTDAVVFFEGLIEYNPEAEHIHAVDLFGAKLGLYGLEHKLDYAWLAWEQEWAGEEYPRSIANFDDSVPRIGIQCAASSMVRSYHPQLMAVLISLLQERGYEVFIFGKHKQISCDVPGVVNLCDRELTMRQSVAIMSTCDVMVTPDSALFHIAQAIGVPSVGLFGPFPGHLRATTGPSIVLNAEGECAPCFYHATVETAFPVNKPCSIAKFCTVLASIAPVTIAEAVDDLLLPNAGDEAAAGKKPRTTQGK